MAKSSRWILWTLFVAAVCCSPIAAAGNEYMEQKQDEAFRKMISSWYSQDWVEYSFWKNELNRYGLLLLQAHLKPAEEGWIKANVWFVRKREWTGAREAAGLPVPRESVTVYLAMLLEQAGVKTPLGPDELVGRALRYENRGSTEVQRIAAGRGWER